MHNILAVCMICFATGIRAQLPSFTIYPLEPGNPEFSDLDSLRTLLKDKQYILLGEQAHSEGSVFSEKVRLIKFLHQELGFSVIAFESGLFDCYHALKAARTGNTIEPMRESVLGIWSDTRELTELFDYILATQTSGNPLQLAGFDDLSSRRFRDEFWSELVQEGRLSEEEKGLIEPVLYGTAEHLVQSDSAVFLRRMLENLHNRLPEETEEQRVLKMAFNLWSQGISWQLDELQGKKILVQNPRDKWMADGFIFLTEEYPGEKIIGWGASFHFANEVTRFKNTDLTRDYAGRMQAMDHDKDSFDLDSALTGAVPMGKFLKDTFGDKLFSLAFTAFQGKYRMISSSHESEILTPPENGLEHWANTIVANGLILPENDSSWFYSSALGHLPVYANWPRIFDGIYFMRDVHPPNPLDFKEEIIAGRKTADSKLYGIITDAETMQPVPYAAIQVSGMAKGVASNAVGEFELNATAISENLIISSIGYENDTISIDQIDDFSNFRIRLKPKSFLLSEVTIRDRPLTAREIIKRAKNAVAGNYADKAFNQEVYYSVLNRAEDSLYFNEQGTVFTYFPDGYQPKSKSFGTILQYREKEDTDHKYEGMGSLWLIFSHDVILDNDNILSRTGAYDYAIEKVLAYQDRLVYDISFTCTRPTAFTTGYGYPAPETASGHIYIATDDFAVLKYDICVERQSYTPKRYPHLVQYPRHHHLSQSFSKHNGRYYLQHSFVEMTVTTLNTETGNSRFAVQQQYLSAMELITENISAITRPLVQLGQQSAVTSDAAFYSKHGYIIDQDRRYDFYCADDL